ncbi:hypothetical protein Mpsy_1902 [Methanolobus psychrophilus R15]|nr:hypothetical protein Mpsy_1902 [Methanolobus psychrophilus R15]
MTKPLLDVIFASEKRKNVLLLLQDGPKQMQFILKSLNTTRQNLLPQMSILKEHYLVNHYEDTYELTTIGKLVVDEMAPLISTVETFDVDIDYWGTHNVDSIPPHLLNRIKEIGKYDAICPSLSDMYNPPSAIYRATKEMYEEADTFNDATSKSSTYCGFSTFLYPNTDEIISNMLKNNTEFNFIIYEPLFERIQNEEYAYFKEFISNPLLHLYVYPAKPSLLSFALNDFHFLIRLLNNEGNYDNKYIFCSSESALKWGKELFEYYLKDSIPITEL